MPQGSRRLIIVGEGPNQTHQGREVIHPLYGGPARVLAGCAGWAPGINAMPATLQRFDRLAYKELYRRARLYNLCIGRWGLAEARISAALIRDDNPDPVLVLLGRRVALAFGCGHQEFFQAVSCGVTYGDEDGKTWEMTEMRVVIPHPSGLNRMYNDPEVRRRVGETLRVMHGHSLHGWE